MIFLNSLATESWTKRAAVTLRQSSESFFCSSERRGGPEVLARAEPTLNLGIAQVRVALNMGPRAFEESENFFIDHNLPVSFLGGPFDIGSSSGSSTVLRSQDGSKPAADEPSMRIRTLAPPDFVRQICNSRDSHVLCKKTFN